MNVLIDTNILISAILNADSTPAKAYFKAVMYPCHGMICEQTMDELVRIFNKKFPTRIPALEKFLLYALRSLEVVPIPENEENREMMIRDAMDRPILRAAIYAEAEILLTGDKDFLESGLTAPAIMTAAEFLALDIPEETES